MSHAHRHDNYTSYSKMSSDGYVKDTIDEESHELAGDSEEPLEGQLVMEEASPEVFEETASEIAVDISEHEVSAVEPDSTSEPSHEPIPEPEIRKIGKVSNCEQLNIRRLPSRGAEILTVVKSGAELMIDEKGSTIEFYKICTEHGIEGYCMKKFITVLL